MQNLYQQNIIDNYNNPQNYGKLSKYTHYLKLENTSCGDEIEVYLIVKNQKVDKIKFKASGCAISVASMSLLSEKIKQMTLDKINKLTYEDITNLLGIIPNPSRMKCALLGLETVQKSIKTE